MVGPRGSAGAFQPHCIEPVQDVASALIEDCRSFGWALSTIARICLILLAPENSFLLKPARPSGVGKASEIGAICVVLGEEKRVKYPGGVFFFFVPTRTSQFFLFLTFSAFSISFPSLEESNLIPRPGTSKRVKIGGMHALPPNSPLSQVPGSTSRLSDK